VVDETRMKCGTSASRQRIPPILLRSCVRPDFDNRAGMEAAVARVISDKVPVHKLSHLEHRDNLLAVEYRQ
jgi:hypothetical protein